MDKADTHPTSEELGAYSTGCLPEARALEIDAHITTCKACCDTIIGLNSEDTFVGILRGANELPADEAPVEGRASNVAGEFSPALSQHARYEIQEKIGSGGMGDVYKARHRVMQRDVAIKVIRPSLLQQPENVKRFQREVTTAAQLTHPNVVAAFDAEQADTEHFMVMEYVDGVNLAEVVSGRGRLAVAEACEFIRQAALGLHYAHERGMVHRDIKPQNLMLTKERTVKILDFGLASLNEGTPSEETPSSSVLTTFGSVMGTPDYVSPEQAVDARETDARSDLYSLGMTLYFLLAGRSPFPQGSATQKLEAQKERHPTPLRELRDDLPKSLLHLIDKMIAKAPQGRYQSACEVAAALQPFCDGASGEPQTSRQGPTFSGSIFRVASLSACLFAAIFAAIIYYIQTDSGTVKLEVADESISVLINGDKIKISEAGSETITLRTGEKKLMIRHGESELLTDRFTLRRNDEVRLSVELLQGKVVLSRDGQHIGTATKSQDLELLEGVWQASYVVEDTQMLPAETIETVSYRISGEDIYFIEGDEITSARLVVDPFRSPKQIDAIFQDGTTRLGIYEVTDFNLRVCWSKNETRPQDFYVQQTAARNVFARFVRTLGKQTQTAVETALYEPHQIAFVSTELDDAEGDLVLKFSTPADSGFFCPGVRLKQSTFGTEVIFVRSQDNNPSEFQITAVNSDSGSRQRTIRLKWLGESLYIRGSQGRSRIAAVDGLRSRPKQETRSTIKLSGCKVSGKFDSECNAIIAVENPSDIELEIQFDYEILNVNSLIPADTRSVLRGSFEGRIAARSTSTKVVALMTADEKEPPLYKSFRDRIEIRVMTKGAEANGQAIADWPAPKWLKRATSEDSLETLVARELVAFDHEAFERTLNQFNKFSSFQRRGCIKELLHQKREFLVAKLLSESHERSRLTDITYFDDLQVYSRIMKMVAILNGLKEADIPELAPTVLKNRAQERRINEVRSWFSKISPRQAADYLIEFARSGNEEFATELFKEIPAKQQMEILQRIHDNGLRVKLSGESAAEETLRRRLISQ